MRLARVGYENVAGTLNGGMSAWKSAGLPVESIVQLPAAGVTSPGRRVLDVRRDREWEEGHVAGARHIPLAQLPARLAELDRDAEWTVFCRSGYRSSIATSVLRRAGFPRVVNTAGGLDAYRESGLPLEVGSPAGA
jgi:hydroxyacylglutathione hydrolase